MDIYYIDGEFTTADKAVIPVDDLVILRGFGVFDFLRTYNRKPFHIDAHLERLENSAKLIGLNLPKSLPEIKKIVFELIEKNPHLDELNIRIIITGGSALNSITPEGNERLLILATACQPTKPEWYTEGAKAITIQQTREMPEAKSMNYLHAVSAQRLAYSKGAIEAIYVDGKGRLLEGTTTNVFVIKNGIVMTADTGILPGVTRKVLIELIKEHFQLAIRDVPFNELESFDEMFISASNKEIIPIIQVDETPIGTGKPGPITQEIMKLFKAYTQNSC